VEKSFACLDLPVTWEETGEEEVGRHAETSDILVRVDPRYYRPTEVELLLGDASKAKAELGWQPSISFDELVELMTKTDYDKLQA